MLNEKEVKNMNNVNLGQEFKNYKELCAYLGEQEKGGKSKDLQIKDWERYFSFEKQGHKFIITDVYDIPKEKVRKQRKVEDKPLENHPEIFFENPHLLPCRTLMKFRFTA